MHRNNKVNVRDFLKHLRANEFFQNRPRDYKSFGESFDFKIVLIYLCA